MLAASGRDFSTDDLEYASDEENHPQRIVLPGGPQYGRRPPDARGRRLPTPFLSYAHAITIARGRTRSFGTRTRPTSTSCGQC